MRLRSCKTIQVSEELSLPAETLTGNAGEELLGKLLNVRAREWNEAVGLEKVKHALSIEVSHDADVVPEIKAIAEVDAAVHVVLVVGRQSREHTELNARSIAILGHRANHLDGALGPLPLVPGLDNLAERALAEQLDDLVCAVLVSFLESWDNVTYIDPSSRPRVGRYNGRHRRRPFDLSCRISANG